jgi:Zn finger protein HypA/HybF involved in hydrogenase expression
LKRQDSEKFFSTIDNTELLLFLYKIGETALVSGVEKRLSQMGKKIRVEEYDKEGKCSSCNGAGRGDVRVPYTDRDWEWERCEHCNGTGRELFHLKAYFIENIKE